MKYLLFAFLLFPCAAFAQHSHTPAKEPAPVALTSAS